MIHHSLRGYLSLVNHYPLLDNIHHFPGNLSPPRLALLPMAVEPVKTTLRTLAWMRARVSGRKGEPLVVKLFGSPVDPNG